jgi:fluoroacetyl-CoA thioesterase
VRKKTARRKPQHKKSRPVRSVPRSAGPTATVEKIVPHEWTIASYDPRLPAVLSTPAMIGMMEMAAAQAIQPRLPPGAITVGTRIEVDHLKAVPAGATVIAVARLARKEGRFLVFEVEARSSANVIGRGRVFRAVVNTEGFTAKAAVHGKSQL